ncbi:ribonuclease 2-5A-domain-containing protein [Mycena olivaceomarginata]|nr:ribonuclease 2-5A-domain-containing protein [Mycena olivaceomarginata]
MARCEEGESGAHSNFLYIALELCPATLADLIETPDRDAWRDIAVAFDSKRASRQIAGGPRHLHGLKLVHCDIKPQNILVSARAGGGGAKAYRMLISDFGLCKKLDVDQTSFLPTSHGAMVAGTGAKNLQGLERFGEEGEEAVDLISSMLHAEAHERPDTTTCLLHPFFWDPARRLTFLQDASDRFEIMTRIPKEPYLLVLERGASGIVGNDWLSRLDPLFLENLGKFRKYDGRSVQDLLRALRNKKHHYQDLPDKVKRNLGPLPEGFLAYFTRRFSASMFRSYFELHD